MESTFVFSLFSSCCDGIRNDGGIPWKRCLACSISSSISTHAPSPMTNPSRCVSKGRDATLGVSLYFVDRARNR